MRFIVLLLILIVIFAGFNCYSFNLPELTRSANEKNFFDIAGKRIFFTGFENGKGEIWSPPYQLISNFEVTNGDTKKLIPLKYKITPAFSEITFDDYILTYCPDVDRPLFIIKITKKHGNNPIKFKLMSSLRANWPVDVDSPGGIETKVYDGWVEGGPLAEGQIAKGHTTFYLASLYVKALQDMEHLSYQLKDQIRQNIALSLIDKAKESLELYWNEKGFYNHRKYPDGTYGLNLTMMPSVGFIFNVTDANRALINLININGHDIVTPWGARIISEYDPLYDPTLYHAGNVWPLFSGWLSLADYKYNLSEEG